MAVPPTALCLRVEHGLPGERMRRLVNGISSPGTDDSLLEPSADPGALTLVRLAAAAETVEEWAHSCSREGR